MPWHGTYCQPALVSELHRGQQKDSPPQHIHQDLFICVATLWAENSSVVIPNPVWLQRSIYVSLVGFSSVWVLCHISRFKMPSTSNNKFVKQQLRAAVLIASDALYNCLYVCHVVTLKGLMGGAWCCSRSARLEAQRSPLCAVCSGFGCFPLHSFGLCRESIRVSVRSW